ncbi:MAG: hypothetical protein LUE24_01530 [Lachnospiraceae bacterium]|nr:hypothetical protein [Lachnospiraceae bacterium]
MRKLWSLLLVCALTLSLAACGSSSGAESTAEESSHVIGIAVYNASDPEMSMFYTYYREYIAESFPVEFIISESLDTLEDEVAFVETVKDAGGEGIISFYTSDLAAIVETCAENEIYYVQGSGSLSDDEFDSVKDNPWYLGVIGPDDDEEFAAGRDMAADFIADGATSFLIVSGGAGDSVNYMHYTRVEGMLHQIQESFGLTYAEDLEELAQVTELTTVETDNDEVTIVISPGYVSMDEGRENLLSALDAGDYDALMSAMTLSDVFDALEEGITANTALMRIGVVDCFSQENYDAFEEIAANGYGMLHYIKGKYASMVAPAFVALFNAMEGDVDLVNPDGEAFRIYQTYWTAASEAEYAELFGYTQSIYENAYSAADMMNVIRSYNADATYDEFVELAESSDIESVRARLAE